MSYNTPQEQPGLEVAPESGLPQVVQGPTIIEKSPDGATQYQQPQYQNNAYGYPPSAYPPQGQPHYSASQEGTYVGTSGFSPSSAAPGSVPPNGGTILGLKKRTFWFIFGPLIALLIIGLAVGLGVGLSVGSRDSGSSSSGGTSATSTPTPSATNAAPTPIVCPQANGTTYQAGSNSFLVLCNVDYNGNGGSGTTDIGNRETRTVEDCIDACAGNAGCAGAGWGDYEGHNTCWMKGSLGRGNDAPNWFFVIRQ